MLNRLTIPQAAQKLLGTADLASQQELRRRLLRVGGASMVYHLISDDDLTRILRHPMVAVASDSGLNVFGEGVPHASAYGHVVGVPDRYVREDRVIFLEEAIRKMTSQPADPFGFADRGRLTEGLAADVVIVDPKTVGHLATYAEPHQHPTGMVHVLVNGESVVRDGAQVDARPGRVLRHQRSGPR